MKSLEEVKIGVLEDARRGMEALPNKAPIWIKSYEDMIEHVNEIAKAEVGYHTNRIILELQISAKNRNYHPDLVLYLDSLGLEESDLSELMRNPFSADAGDRFRERINEHFGTQIPTIAQLSSAVSYYNQEAKNIIGYSDPKEFIDSMETIYNAGCCIPYYNEYVSRASLHNNFFGNGACRMPLSTNAAYIRAKEQVLANTQSNDSEMSQMFTESAPAKETSTSKTI
mgnify:CR=1 FL=1